LTFPVHLEADWQSRFEEAAEQKLRAYLKQFKGVPLLPPRLKFIRTISKRKLALEALKICRDLQTPLIFAQTRSKKKWTPLRLGSFSETLAVHLAQPVLLLPPSAQVAPKIERILFPTDFSRESKSALKELIPTAKMFDAEVILFNQVEMTNFYPVDFYGAWQTEEFNFETIARDYERDREKSANALMQELSKAGVEGEFLHARQERDLAREIVSIAKKKGVGMIAMATAAGPVERMILGSVTQDVILKANCPVLIYSRPPSKKEKGQKPPILVNPKDQLTETETH